MGAFASAPVDLIRVQRSGGKFWKAAVAEMQGWRVSHEDAHFMVDGDDEEGWSVFAVLDGHGGASVAKLGSQRLPGELKAVAASSDATTLERLVRTAFVATDAWLREHPESCEAGSTVTAGAVRVSEVKGVRAYNGYLANAGFVSDQTAVPRLDGNLSVSRGFGDFAFKDASRTPEEQKLSCVPEVTNLAASSSVVKLEDGDLLVFACDGVFDVLSNEDLAALIFEGTARRDDLGDVAAHVIRVCLARDSKDNMTLMIIELGAADGLTYAQTALGRGAEAEKTNVGSHSSTISDAADEAYGLNKTSTDEFLGLERLEEPLEPEVKRSYLGFLEFCAAQYGLPPKAARALRTAREGGNGTNNSNDPR